MDSSFARRGRYKGAESLREVLELVFLDLRPKHNHLIGVRAIMIQCHGAKRIDQAAGCCRDGFVGFPGDVIQSLSGDRARLGTSGFRSSRGTKSTTYRGFFGQNDVSFPRHTIKRHREG